MKIETKFSIGEQVYVVYERHNCVEIFLDTIDEIAISKNRILYFVEQGLDDVPEEDVYGLDEFDKIRFRLIKQKVEGEIDDVENK